MPRSPRSPSGGSPARGAEPAGKALYPRIVLRRGGMAQTVRMLTSRFLPLPFSGHRKRYHEDARFHDTGLSTPFGERAGSSGPAFFLPFPVPDGILISSLLSGLGMDYNRKSGDFSPVCRFKKRNFLEAVLQPRRTAGNFHFLFRFSGHGAMPFPAGSDFPFAPKIFPGAVQ